MKKFFNFSYIIFFTLALLSFKASAVPTFVDSYSVSSEESQPRGFTFNKDGTKMFIAGYDDDAIDEYTLSTAWDVSTASFVDSFVTKSDDEDTRDVKFNQDGTKMFVLGKEEDEVFEYTLTTGFDVSTASFVGSFSVKSEDGKPTSLEFSSDGSKMFVLGAIGKDVNEYTLSCYYGVVNCSNPTTLKDVLGSIEAQTETARRIVQHVTTPVLNRMDWLRRHRKEDSLTNQNIKFNFSNEMLASLSKVMPVAAKVNEASNLSDNWSFWSEGSVSVGKVGDTASSSSKDINSNGITIGIDKKINENKLYGYALRLGKDDVDVGKFTSLDTSSYSLSAYGTFPHDDTKFVEGILGISALKTDHITQGGGTNRTGERNGRQGFGSINYLTTFNKNKFNITPNARVDVSYTELSEYSETGNSALRHNKQKIETGMISAGLTLSDIIEFNSITFKPNGGLELGLDFSPSSDATYSYISETTEYKKSIGQDSKNIRANIGFDLITENGFSIMTIYERDQSDNSHSDTLYLGVGYIPSEDIEYAMSLDDDKVFFNYKRIINGFDITFSSNYSLMSEIPEYAANLKIANRF